MTQPHHHRARRGILAGSMILFFSVLNGVPAAQAAVNCVTSFGVTQTETTVTGTSANDTIACGGALPGKTINGGNGNDTITGTVFIDKINGEGGNDTITGTIGDDVVDGGLGDDTMTGSAGNDRLSAAPATTP